MTVWREPDRVRAEGPVLFVDRDGVVIEDCHYLADPQGVVLLPGSAAALRRARAAGLGVVGVSNQSGLGRGRFGQKEFAAVMGRLEEALAAEGAAFDAFYYCPHAPEADCRCRKPRPGLLEEASRRLPWDPARSWVVGDKVSDVELGRRAGLGAVLVRTGYGAAAEHEIERTCAGDERVLVVDDLAAAVAAVLVRADGGRP